jgi:hypothetical protein
MSDPISTHVSALELVLHGPRRTRRGMISEARAGLRDAEAAYREGGYPAEAAAASAVRDFGTVREIAPEFQDELTARQGRWSAVLYALVFPGMMLSWDLFWSFGWTRESAGPASQAVIVLARIEDAASLAIGAAALAVLVLSFRRSVPAHRLTRAIGIIGAVGAMLCGGLALVMNVAGTHKAAVYILTHPVSIVPYAGSALMMVLIIWQSHRTIRVANAAAHGQPWRPAP